MEDVGGNVRSRMVGEHVAVQLAVVSLVAPMTWTMTIAKRPFNSKEIRVPARWWRWTKRRGRCECADDTNDIEDDSFEDSEASRSP